MSNIDIELVIPEELSDMEIITTVMSPVMEDVGILIMGEHLHLTHGENLPTIRLYQLLKLESKFHVEHDLGAFAFYDYISAKSFLDRLPHMSAFELLILMHNQDISIGEENAIHH